jgi:hypothetical protein
MSGCGQHRLLVILTTAGVRVYREKKSRSLFLISKPSKQQNHFECSEKNNMCTRLQDLLWWWFFTVVCSNPKATGLVFLHISHVSL